MKLARQQYRKVNLSEVEPHPRNPRKGSLEAIGESLEANDFYGAIVVQKSSGYVLAGNHRLLAAKRAGAKELPAMVVDCDDETALRILLADNATSDKAEYDSPELHALLKEIGQEAGTLEGTGWGFDDFRALEREMAKLTNGDAGADEVPEPPAEPRSKLGEIYELGPHRLMCGDATDAEQVAELLAGEEPALCVTDPPYGVDYDPAWRQVAAEQGHLAYAARRVGEVANDERVDWREAWELVPSDVLYCWHAGRHASSVQAGIESVGFEVRCQIIWAKPHLPISRGHYHWRHEPCWYAVRSGKTARWVGDRTQSTLWEIPLDRNVEGGHSTQKPVECMLRPLRNHEGDVFDPFAGTGSTLIAAEMMNRRAFLMEIDPRWCDVMRDRYELFTSAALAA